MDSSRGIPVEYKLDAFNMPRTGTTLCHPKIGYVDPSVIPLSTHLLHLWATLMETNTRFSTRRTKTMVTPKHNPSHVRRHTLPSQPSQLLITQFRLNKHNLSTSLAAPKANPIFHAANKNLFIKTHFDSRHLTSSSFYLLFLTTISEGPYKLSEETTQRKHTYVTTIFLANKQTSPSLPTTKTSYNLKKLRNMNVTFIPHVIVALCIVIEGLLK